jgi:hypothetical protein
MGTASTASKVIALVDKRGVGALARSYGISRRQAEHLDVAARRAVAVGLDLDPELVPHDTVRVAEVARDSVPAVEPASVDLDGEAETRARRIRALLPSDRMRAELELSARAATMERNLGHGHLEWTAELAVLQRTLELVRGVVV